MVPNETGMTDETDDGAAREAKPKVRFDASPIVIVTRFSFLGESGWKSDASRSADLLFEADRLNRRLELFCTITLPSLAAQTDQGFRHFILTSKQLPKWAMAELRAACTGIYGESGRFSVIAATPGPASQPLRLFLQRHFAGRPVVQVVLDDDDGLAATFIARLRTELGLLDDDPPDDLRPLPYFISFASGYALSLRADAAEAPAVFRHRYPYINLGLTLIGMPGGKNVLAIAHKKAPRRFGGKLIEDIPMFLRSVHEVNDSRVTPGRNWQEIENWPQDEDLRRQFPGLFAEGATWAQAEPPEPLDQP